MIEHIILIIRQGKTVHEVIDGAGMSRLRTAAVLAGLINYGVVGEKDNVGPQLESGKATQQPILVKGSLVNRLKSMEGTPFTGMVDIQGRSRPAAIYIEQGRVINAEHGETAGKKALFRIFSERGGKCNIREHSVDVGRVINAPLEELMVEASREIAWRRRLKYDFSNIRVFISTNDSEELAAMEYDSAKIQLLEVVRKHPVMRDIVEVSPFTDLETCRLLEDLRASGILVFRRTT
ncbi:MAG: DUF4388 domain-containing protein [Desulfobacteraceae bacterium]|nr:DUF4388 domain-containing protein [Desulfobacteraceae bacterium]